MKPPNMRALLLSVSIVLLCVGSWFFSAARLGVPAEQAPNADIAAQCAAIENGDLENIPLPITCTLRIHGDETAEFTFQPNGGLLITRSKEVLLSLQGGEGASDHTAQLTHQFDDQTLRSDGFTLGDITFDGYADLQVMTFAGAYNFGYDFYAYNPQTRTFGPNPILEDVVNPDVDLERKEITYFYKGRGPADTFSAGTYQFKDGAYVLTETVEQDMVTEYDDPNPLYERITSKLEDGKMVVVKKEILTVKDVWGE